MPLLKVQDPLSEASEENLDKKSSEIKSTTFHTPPPVDPNRQSWLTVKAEQESYGNDSLTPVTSDPLSSPPSSSASSITSNHDIYSSKNQPETDTNGENGKKSHNSQSIPTDDTVTTSDIISHISNPNQPYNTTTNLPPILSHAIDKFVSNLKAPRYKAPLEPNTVSLLYQTFYKDFNAKADEYLTQSTINMGAVAAAAGAVSNNGSSSPSKDSTNGSLSQQANSSAALDNSSSYLFRRREIKMETYEEIAEKRRERALRPVRLKEFTETAEARATTMIYDNLFQPKTGLDIDRDNSITTRIKALRALPLTTDLLAIDLPVIDSHDNGDFEEGTDSKKQTTVENLLHILEPVASHFRQINKEKTPAGKLSAYLEGHKLMVAKAMHEIYPDICDSSFSNKSSTTAPKSNIMTDISNTKPRLQATSVAADNILPLLIYVFVHFDIEHLWLNLSYIMRYRNASVIESGDISYSLTNWQAALAFIETVTLESLGVLEKYPHLVHKKEEDNLKNSDQDDNDNDSLIGHSEDEDEDENKEASLKNDDQEELKDKELTILLEPSSFFTDFDIFTAPPATLKKLVGTKKHPGLAASLFGVSKAQKLAEETSKSPNQQTNGNSRRISSLSTNDLVISADQSIKSIGNTFSKFLLSKINSKDSQSDQTTLSETSNITNKSLSHRLSRSLLHHNNTLKLNNDGTSEPGSPASLTSSISNSNDASQTNNNDSSASSQDPLIGRIVKTIRSNSDFKPLVGTNNSSTATLTTTSNSTIQTPDNNGHTSQHHFVLCEKISPPLEHVISKEWTQLNIGEIQQLHNDYKRLAEFLKQANAFERK